MVMKLQYIFVMSRGLKCALAILIALGAACAAAAPDLSPTVLAINEATNLSPPPSARDLPGRENLTWDAYWPPNLRTLEGAFTGSRTLFRLNQTHRSQFRC